MTRTPPADFQAEWFPIDIKTLSQAKVRLFCLGKHMHLQIMIWPMRRYLDNGLGHKEIKLARAALFSWAVPSVIFTWAMPSVVHVCKTCQEKFSLTHFIGISGLLYAPLCLQHASNICMVYFYSSHHKREGGELTVVFAYDKGWPNIVQEASYF